MFLLIFYFTLLEFTAIAIVKSQDFSSIAELIDYGNNFFRRFSSWRNSSLVASAALVRAMRP